MQLLGNLEKGLLFIVSAPAGTGKTTLVDMLLNEFPCLAETCSCTTREPRIGEISGKHYHFINRNDFEIKIAAGEFLEHAQVFGNYYGTLKQEVIDLQLQGKHVILVIDTQGAFQLMGKIPATFIFISPPSFDVLADRLKKRRTESAEKISERLEWATHEMRMAKWYHYHIINDDLQIAYQVLKSILIAEEHRVRK